MKLYFCDPKKNTKCRQTVCQFACIYTTNPDYAKTTFGGMPVEVVLRADNDKKFCEMQDSQ